MKVVASAGIAPAMETSLAIHTETIASVQT